jgi:hypothetical protein
MADASLLTMFDEIRGKTLWLLNVSPEEARWTPPGTDNSILWHAGHIYCMVERLVQSAVPGGATPAAVMPANWWEIFGWDSAPQSVPADRWPALSEVIDRLREQHGQIRMTLSQLTEGKLSTPLRLPNSGWDGAPARRLLVHAFHDEASHGGEIWLLRKMKVHVR